MVFGGRPVLTSGPIAAQPDAQVRHNGVRPQIARRCERFDAPLVRAPEPAFAAHHSVRVMNAHVLHQIFVRFEPFAALGSRTGEPVV